MPYVQVWVEDEPCDGTCAGCLEADSLKMSVDEAIRHLSSGDVESALGALGKDGVNRKDPSSIKSAYERWKMGKLPGFTNYQNHSETLQ